MVRSHFAPAVPAAPPIDAAEVNWAAGELAALLRRAAPDSAVEAVLHQALRELDSLKASAVGQVVGPFRVKAA